MINFRFHLVSLIAVFLALAAGIVIGSQVVDQAIVDGLRDQLDDVETRSDEIQRENDALQAEIDRREEELEEAAPFAVDGRLTGVPVPVLALRDTDEDAVDALVERLREAGARVPAVLWLEEAWALEDADQEERLQGVLDSSATGSALRQEGVAALAARLTTTVLDRGGGEGGAQPEPADDLLRRLADAGFVTVDTSGGFDADDVAAWPGPGARAVIATASDGVLVADAFEASLARTLDGSGLRVTVVEAWRETEDGPDRGARLAAVRDDDDLAGRVSTVDTLDLTAGQVAVVVALQDLGHGIVGHYGYGDGTSRPLPVWTR